MSHFYKGETLYYLDKSIVRSCKVICYDEDTKLVYLRNWNGKAMCISLYDASTRLHVNIEDAASKINVGSNLKYYNNSIDRYDSYITPSSTAPSPYDAPGPLRKRYLYNEYSSGGKFKTDKRKP